ncbi:50S ribosomal protein L13P [Aeropyrum pernix K1]|uniref:Large ribosomal subunit protein uL13 n=1 Tax=Aeropyrum pernix (strain ATCC 700893 / DSM 11879 / JCM 9820 / NBRC 100138 / K1) TaxID=272557 RepID=RL13_AERPE|nr:50S ribosomal protein L13 [Aeropyrum pernix]Q9YB50.1 RecName: Full=Large ribosomal subunit protein uL13; AltName: Full=50S ribosomal protein L13 [Aeropyrum pernix K1]BAA80748.1 50S ribosomal protein L13P [Aeropyrum pernix K1]
MLLAGGEAREIVVDGSGMIMGRLASVVAKLLLAGWRVNVVNAEKIVLSGDPRMVVESYRTTVLGVKSHFSHKWRPKRPRTPQRLFKHAVRGMLPKNKARGRRALARLRVYVGVPDELKGREFVRFPEADASRLSSHYIELGAVARQLGWKGGVEK